MLRVRVLLQLVLVCHIYQLELSLGCDVAAEGTRALVRLLLLFFLDHVVDTELAQIVEAALADEHVIEVPQTDGTVVTKFESFLPLCWVEFNELNITLGYACDQFNVGLFDLWHFFNQVSQRIWVIAHSVKPTSETRIECFTDSPRGWGRRCSLSRLDHIRFFLISTAEHLHKTVSLLSHCIVSILYYFYD